MASLFEQALSSIGAGIADIRERVAEEAWFGRVVTGGQDAPESSESGAVPPVTATEESPQILCLFDQKLDTIISAPIDPDIQPHGQAMDR